MAKDYKIPLGAKMTSWKMVDQNPEWYNENLIVIVTVYREVGDQIAKECKRRNILHDYSDHHFYMGEVIDGRLVDRPKYKVKIKETGLKVQQLAEWALTRYNTDDSYYIRSVWIEIQDQKK